MINLREFRELRNLKHKDMAQILQMKNISQYQELEKDVENGKILSIKNALKLAEYFDISLDEIYGIKKSDSSETELPEIVSIYNQLTEQGKAELLNFAKFKLSEQNG